MSVVATQWAWQQALKPTIKLVLLALADRANPAGECWPSTAKLVTDTGLYRETVYSSIQSLEDVKLIQVSRKTGRGNVYKLLINPSSNQSDFTDRSGCADQSEKADPTRLVLPTTTSAFTDYHQSAFADTNLKEEPNNNLPLNLKDVAVALPPQKAEQMSEEQFEVAWSHYPARSGGNPKSKALKAWNARIKEGCSFQEIIDGVIRYHAWCDATGKTGGEFVKQAVTFFGPDKHFREPWTIPANPNGVNKHASKYQKSTAIAGQIFGAAVQANAARRASAGGDRHIIPQDDGHLLPALD